MIDCIKNENVDDDDTDFDKIDNNANNQQDQYEKVDKNHAWTPKLSVLQNIN